MLVTVDFQEMHIKKTLKYKADIFLYREIYMYFFMCRKTSNFQHFEANTCTDLLCYKYIYVLIVLSTFSSIFRFSRKFCNTIHSVMGKSNIWKKLSTKSNPHRLVRCQESDFSSKIAKQWIKPWRLSRNGVCGEEQTLRRMPHKNYLLRVLPTHLRSSPSSWRRGPIRPAWWRSHGPL